MFLNNQTPKVLRNVMVALRVFGSVTWVASMGNWCLFFSVLKEKQVGILTHRNQNAALLFLNSN